MVNRGAAGFISGLIFHQKRGFRHENAKKRGAIKSVKYIPAALLTSNFAV
jgi:hypothetical protein